MRLSKFLLIEQNVRYKTPRSKIIGFDDAINFALKKCKISFFKESYAFRSLLSTSLFRITDPKKGEPRKSFNTQNYYTLIIDNSSKWKKYPKRSKSIICSAIFGDYYVLPIDGSKWGICPYWDFWVSFRDGSKIGSLPVFNECLELLAQDVLGLKTHFDKNIKVVKNVFEMIDKEKASNYELFLKKTKFIKGDDKFSFFLPYINKQNLKLYTFCEQLLDPAKNNFKIAKVGINLKNMTDDVEVWTDGVCLLVGTKIWKKFKEVVEKKKNEI